MSKDIRTDHEYQVAEFGDFGFRILTGASLEGERFSSIMALEESSINVLSTRNGDSSAEIILLAGMIIYGDLYVDSVYSGKLIAYLRGE
jgi:hypothetical protein